MLALQTSSTSPKRTIPHILPCTIKHSGPIPAPSQRLWNPQPTTSPNPSSPPQSDEETYTTYLRGRKLLGRKVPLPTSHTGYILQKTDSIVIPPLVPNDEDDEDDDDGEAMQEVKIMKTEGTFDSIMVWAHERLPSKEEDAYIKGLEEWMDFAEKMHAYNTPQENHATTKTAP